MGAFSLGYQIPHPIKHRHWGTLLLTPLGNLGPFGRCLWTHEEAVLTLEQVIKSLGPRIPDAVQGDPRLLSEALRLFGENGTRSAVKFRELLLNCMSASSRNPGSEAISWEFSMLRNTFLPVTSIARPSGRGV